MKELWVCGKYLEQRDNGAVWEMQGVFSSEEKAVAACLTEDFFIGPVELDKAMPEERIVWYKAYYPKAKR